MLWFILNCFLSCAVVVCGVRSIKILFKALGALFDSLEDKLNRHNRT